MRAGFFELDITPPYGTAMPGGFIPYIAEDSWTDLLVSAAAFTEGDKTVILVSADVLLFSVEYADEVRQRISMQTGVPIKNIMVCAIHTHTGPAVEYDLWQVKANLEVSSATADKMVACAVAAFRDQKEVSISYGAMQEPRFNACRNYWLKDGTCKTRPGYKRRKIIVGPAGRVDHTLSAMRLENAEGKVEAVLVNYACHSDTGSYDVKQRIHFSADFPGYMRDALKKEYGEDVKVLFFNGAAGDVAASGDITQEPVAWYFRTGKLGTAVIGEELAEDIIRRMSFEKFEGPAHLDAKSETCTVSRRYVDKAHREAAREFLAKGDFSDIQDTAYAYDYAVSDEDMDPEIDIEVQTLRVGPWALVALPSEIFSEIGRAIREASPFDKTLIVELANGTHGYIAPGELLKTGIYEAKVHYYNSCTGYETADTLIERSTKMLNQMSEEENQ